MHLRDHVGGVGGGGAVGAQAHAQTVVQELGERGDAHAQLRVDARAAGDGDVVLPELGHVMVIDIHAVHHHNVVAFERAPVQHVVDRRGARGQPRRDLHEAARGVHGVDGEGRGAVAHEVAFLAVAGDAQRHGEVLLGGKLSDLAEDLRVAGEQRRRRKADGQTVGVDFFLPMCQVVLGLVHGEVNATAVHGAHLAVDDAAHAELLHGSAASARGGDVGHGGDAAGKRLETAQDGRVVPIRHVHLRGQFAHGHDPGGIGDIVDDAAHDRVLQVGVQVDEAGQDGRLAEIGDLLIGIAQLEHGGVADVADGAVANEHRTVVDGFRRDGKHVLRAQKHGLPRLFRDLQVNTYDSTDERPGGASTKATRRAARGGELA